MATNEEPEPGTQQVRRGGQAVRAKYGSEFYSKIGKKGGDSVKEKNAEPQSTLRSARRAAN